MEGGGVWGGRGGGRRGTQREAVTRGEASKIQ